MANPGDATLPQRLNRRVFWLAFFLAAAFLAVGSFRPMMDNVDLGWHLAQGRWMAEHGAIYRHDVLNYPTFGRPVVDEYPLFQLVLYFAWKMGWWGPCLLTAVGYVLLVGLLARGASVFRLEGSAALTLALGAMLSYLQLAFPLRPHLVTYLGVVTLGIFLLRHRSAQTWTEFWPMALLQVAWTNSHGGFVLGPAMTGLFGLEMTLRRWRQDRVLPWATARVWAGAFLLILFACLLNPFGPAIFYPPFFQDRLESIRAYVGEMEPLGGAMADLYFWITLVAAGGISAALARRRDFSWSLFVLAALLLEQSLSVKKSWPVFGLFLPLLVLSSGAMAGETRDSRPITYLNLFGNFLLAALLAQGLVIRLDNPFSASVSAGWRDYNAGRSELSLQAVAWMKSASIEGRLLHRCEDGGWLQESGYDHGETFGDTGLGKYNEAFIRTISMVGERPALLPLYLAAYRPDFVVCDNFSYGWPYYLRQTGWRLIFYSPYSAVWTQPGTRPDLPTVPEAAIKTVFDDDIATHGLPVDLTLYGRNLLELNSLGLEDFAFVRLTSLPTGLHRAPFYWEAARILCFETPVFSPVHRAALVAEAEALHDDALTAEFRAYACDASGDHDGARQILAALPVDRLGSHAADLLLRLDLDENRPGALALAERPGGFDLRDGRHWSYVAEAEAQAGHEAAALRAWKKAVFYYPDDTGLMQEAATFAAKFHETELQRQVDAGAALPTAQGQPHP